MAGENYIAAAGEVSETVFSIILLVSQKELLKLTASEPYSPNRALPLSASELKMERVTSRLLFGRCDRVLVGCKQEEC